MSYHTLVGQFVSIRSRVIEVTLKTGQEEMNIVHQWLKLHATALVILNKLPLICKYSVLINDYPLHSTAGTTNINSSFS